MAVSKAKKVIAEDTKQRCTICQGNKTVNSQNFWMSESIINSSGHLHICSNCVNDLFSSIYKQLRGYGEDFELNGNTIVFDKATEEITKKVCRYIDLKFSYDAYYAWESQIMSFRDSNNAERRKKLFGDYKSKLSITNKQNECNI